MVWQLRDPVATLEPGPVAGRASTSYGLLRADGTERAIADVVRFGRSAVPAPSATERLRAAMPLVVSVALCTAIAAAARGRRRRSTGPQLTRSLRRGEHGPC
jgi:hypothetical protein